MEDRERMAALDLPDEAEYPRQLSEKYELVECFSAQDDAQTLLARDRASGAFCVVKCFFAQNPFYDHTEPEVLRTLDRKPFPGFLGEYKNEHMRCVVREYVEGETLAQTARTGRFDEAQVIRIGSQLCTQLAVLHDLTPPVIHRDIKPQNVVMRPDGNAVLIDFGISRVLSDQETDTVAFGTQGFAPPEQYGFAQTDERSDLYSLGVLLNWMLTGEAGPVRLADTPLKKVLQRCTSFDPKDRYAGAEQLRKALLGADPANRRKRRRVISIAAACGVCGILLAAVFLIRARGRSVTFSDPLLEQAVRLNLGLEDGKKVKKDMLPSVTAVYIMADTAYPDPDSFYAAINQWYALGKPVRGTMKNLEDLEQMPGLEQVCVVAQELEDISALTQLTHLNRVEFKHNYISDISALSGMNRLNWVGLNDNPVKDLSPLAECPNLSGLDLCDVKSYDPQILEQLGNFEYLDLSNPTESYAYLGRRSVSALHLAWTGLTDLHVLDQVTRLEELDISHTAVTDLSPLAAHAGLKRLNLAGISRADLSTLPELGNLESVTISEDMWPEMNALGDLPFEVYVQ